jgi:DNA-binding NarL/FixJ family response regulator
VRVLLADDDPHVRSALRLLLEDEGPVSIVAECSSGSGLVDAVVRSGAQVVLLDWDLPGLAPGELDRLRVAAPTCAVVALSGRPEHRREALSAGVEFASKGDSPEGLIRLLHQLSVNCSNGQSKAEHKPEHDAGRPETLKVVEQPVAEPGAQAPK